YAYGGGTACDFFLDVCRLWDPPASRPDRRPSALSYQSIWREQAFCRAYVTSQCYGVWVTLDQLALFQCCWCGPGGRAWRKPQSRDPSHTVSPVCRQWTSSRCRYLWYRLRYR